ncbi:Long-chain-fatty-acid--CoA ligase 3 [Liparis tanakae]|uniref:Long-chain-fatty-acid--CoA ligase 3 n=1 Tax=Liparis tanakae TaxID=230148 RepID=A0A4Z2E0I5_9TELE|nr:Long-chain-fatty-acid--CoA ligase 3 [Liparis tanakae]
MKQKETLNPALLLLFRLVVWLYTSVTFLPSYVLSRVFGPGGAHRGSEEERAARAKARSAPGRPEGPYRAVSAADGLATALHPGVDTLDKVFEYAATRFPHRDCLGTRELVSEEDEHQGNGKVFKKVETRDTPPPNT